MHNFSARPLYDIYRITITVREQLCGGMPKNKDVIADWIKSTTQYNDEQTKAQTDEAREALLEETTEKSWNGFPGDKEKGIFLWARCIKAMFKECASLRRVTTEKRGSKQIFQHAFEVKALDGGSRVFLGKMEADGYNEGPIHVQTPQGPRTALKRVDYIQGPIDISFEVWVMGTHPSETRHVGEKDLVDMLTFAQENGLGADRSQGMGKFDVKAFEQVQKAEIKEKTETAAAAPAAKKTKKPAAGATAESSPS